MRYFLILLFALLTACGSAVPTVKPFKMDIQQGNVVTSKMLLQLRPGMTKSQVKFILGSPLLVDSFHTNRWDYFYQLRQAGKIVERRRVILDFEKDLLTKVRGDVVPEGTAGAAAGEETRVAKTITVEPKPKQEDGMLDKLKFWKSDEKTVAKPQAVKPEVAKPAEEQSWTDKLKFWKKDEPAKDAAKAETIAREKTDGTGLEHSSAGLEANTSAASGDAPMISGEIPSVLAVPIGGVAMPDAPLPQVPGAEMPGLDPPPPPPMQEVAQEPATPAEAPKLEVRKVETQKIEMAAPAAVSEPKPVAMPAAKAGERLIFRLDRNLNLKNLQAPVEAAPTVDSPKIDTKAAPTKTIKPEPPLPAEEAPGYFERMLEKIGF